MEDFRSCPTCLNEFDLNQCIPLVAQCGHSFCMSCCNLYLGNNLCPMCRREITPPLHRNIALMAYLESSIHLRGGVTDMDQYLTAQYEYSEIDNALSTTSAKGIGTLARIQ
jgi:hypothetical protein